MDSVSAPMLPLGLSEFGQKLGWGSGWGVSLAGLLGRTLYTLSGAVVGKMAGHTPIVTPSRQMTVELLCPYKQGFHTLDQGPSGLHGPRRSPVRVQLRESL